MDERTAWIGQIWSVRLSIPMRRNLTRKKGCESVWRWLRKQNHPEKKKIERAKQNKNSMQRTKVAFHFFSFSLCVFIRLFVSITILPHYWTHCMHCYSVMDKCISRSESFKSAVGKSLSNCFSHTHIHPPRKRKKLKSESMQTQWCLMQWKCIKMLREKPFNFVNSCWTHFFMLKNEMNLQNCNIFLADRLLTTFQRLNSIKTALNSIIV